MSLAEGHANIYQVQQHIACGKSEHTIDPPKDKTIA